MPAVEKAKELREKRKPKQLAVIDQQGCTGCEVCLDFCPVDCILVVPGDTFERVNKLVEVDLDRCIGCTLCAKYCPWETIEMLPYEEAFTKAPEWTLRTVLDKPWIRGLSQAVEALTAR